MVIFYSYVSVPEGTNCETFSYAQPRQLKHKPKSFILESFCKGSLKSLARSQEPSPIFKECLDSKSQIPWSKPRSFSFRRCCERKAWRAILWGWPEGEQGGDPRRRPKEDRKEQSKEEREGEEQEGLQGCRQGRDPKVFDPQPQMPCPTSLGTSGREGSSWGCWFCHRRRKGMVEHGFW